MENPIKMDDLGVSPFSETAMYSFIPLFPTLRSQRSRKV